MKFIVDEMPYYKDDCPFHEIGARYSDLCTCDGYQRPCQFFVMGRDPYYCDWLKEISNDE